MKYDPQTWTYGAEHEWADWDYLAQLPTGYGRDTHDITIVNSNGIANDPKGKLYGFGGEINTPPTDTLTGQIACLKLLKDLYPEAKVNYRSNLHLHIRVPGLKDDLTALKRVQTYIHTVMPLALPMIEPIPRPIMSIFREQGQFKGELRRWRRRRVSHQTLLTEGRLAKQLSATTLDEFFAWEVPQSKEGKPLWHFQPRLCVNLRQLLETDTIEFRHWPGTLNEDELRECLCWCHNFLCGAFGGLAFAQLLMNVRKEYLPQFPKYNHQQEVRYRLTCHDGTNTKQEIADNIQKILSGEL